MGCWGCEGELWIPCDDREKLLRLCLLKNDDDFDRR